MNLLLPSSIMITYIFQDSGRFVQLTLYALGKGGGDDDLHSQPSFPSSKNCSIIKLYFYSWMGRDLDLTLHFVGED